MEIGNVLRHVYSIVLICSCLTVAEEILLVPKKTFLQDKKAKLRCYINVEGLHTSHENMFRQNDDLLKDQGEGPQYTKDKKYVFYELEVNKSGNYSCQEVDKTLGVIYEPPDTPFLPVLEVNTNVSISCPEGPPGSQNRLQIFGKDRDGQMENNTLSIVNVGFKDGFIEGQCLYSFPPDTTDNKFPPDNITVSTEVQPIVMKMDVEKPGSELSINVSCTAYSNVTDLRLSLTASGKDPVYSVFNSFTVSDDFQKNSNNVKCSLWYKNEKIWSKVEPLEEKVVSSDRQNVFPVVIALALVILVSVAVAPVVYKCKRNKKRLGNTGGNLDDRSNEEEAGLGETGVKGWNDESSLPLNKV